MTPKAIAALHSRLFHSNLMPEAWRKYVDLICGQRFQPYLIAAFTLWLVGAVEIIQKTTGQRSDPRFWMLVAILITAYSGVRVFRLSAGVSNVGQNSRSREVDNIMSRLVSSGFAVYHEPIGVKGSDGYVAVGPGGVFTMEVSARNVFGSGTIEFGNNNELILGGRLSDRRPMQYAQTAAAKLREKFTGVSLVQTAIKPLVVFLNEWQITQSNSEREVTILNANQLEKYLATRQAIFTKSQIVEISSYLDN